MPARAVVPDARTALRVGEQTTLLLVLASACKEAGLVFLSVVGSDDLVGTDDPWGEGASTAAALMGWWALACPWEEGSYDARGRIIVSSSLHQAVTKSVNYHQHES